MEDYPRAGVFCSKCGEELRSKMIDINRFNARNGERLYYRYSACPRVIDNWFSYGHDWHYEYETAEGWRRTWSW